MAGLQHLGHRNLPGRERLSHPTRAQHLHLQGLRQLHSEPNPAVRMQSLNLHGDGEAALAASTWGCESTLIREDWWLLLWKYCSRSSEQCDCRVLLHLPGASYPPRARAPLPSSLARLIRIPPEQPQAGSCPPLPSPEEILHQGKGKEGPTSSFALLLSSGGCLPSKGTDTVLK